MPVDRRLTGNLARLLEAGLERHQRIVVGHDVERDHGVVPVHRTDAADEVLHTRRRIGGDERHLTGAARAMCGKDLGLEALLRSPFGILLSAIKADPQRAAFFRYRVMGVRVLVFAIGGGIADLAGGLFAAVEGFVSSTLIGFLLSTEVLVWAALGGREVLLAAFLGAIAVRWIESSLVDLLGDTWIWRWGWC